MKKFFLWLQWSFLSSNKCLKLPKKILRASVNFAKKKVNFRKIQNYSNLWLQNSQFWAFYRLDFQSCRIFFVISFLKKSKENAFIDRPYLEGHTIQHNGHPHPRYTYSFPNKSSLLQKKLILFNLVEICTMETIGDRIIVN